MPFHFFLFLVSVLCSYVLSSCGIQNNLLQHLKKSITAGDQFSLIIRTWIRWIDPDQPESKKKTKTFHQLLKNDPN